MRPEGLTVAVWLIFSLPTDTTECDSTSKRETVLPTVPHRGNPNALRLGGSQPQRTSHSPSEGSPRCSRLGGQDAGPRHSEAGARVEHTGGVGGRQLKGVGSP